MSEPDGLIEFLEGEDHKATDVDKAWDGINFLLKKIAGDPGGFLLEGGEEVGDEEMFDTLPRILMPGEVVEAARLLDRISEADLRAAYDPGELTANNVYPDIWSRDVEDDDALGYLVEHYTKLKSFVASAASDGDGLILDLG